MHPLFPIAHESISSGFTTSPSAASHIPALFLVPLQDSALGVHKVTSNTTHKVVTPPPPSVSDTSNPTEAWEAFYHAGSINPGNKEAPRGGFGFYLRGPQQFSERLRLEMPENVIMSYAVMFEEGWMWQKGGKLPGMCTSLLLCGFLCLRAQNVYRRWYWRFCVRMYGWSPDR